MNDLLTRLSNAKSALAWLARLTLPVSPQAAVYVSQAADKLEAAIQQLKLEERQKKEMTQ